MTVYRNFAASAALCLVLGLGVACGKNQQLAVTPPPPTPTTPTAPPAPPPPPAPPAAAAPRALTEDEIYAQKTADQLTRSARCRMCSSSLIHRRFATTRVVR
jgi:hypothetical protein